MNRTMLKSKIHRGRITGSDLNYVGSITSTPTSSTPPTSSSTSWCTCSTWTTARASRPTRSPGSRGSGEVKVNGAAARLVHSGDTVIVVSYASYDERELDTYEPKVVHVNADNQIVTVDDAVAELLS